MSSKSSFYLYKTKINQAKFDQTEDMCIDVWWMSEWSFTWRFIDENFRDAAFFIAQVSLSVLVQMTFHTAPGVWGSGQTKRVRQSSEVTGFFFFSFLFVFHQRHGLCKEITVRLTYHSFPKASHTCYHPSAGEQWYQIALALTAALQQKGKTQCSTCKV